MTLSPTLHSLSPSLSPRSFVHHYVIMTTTGLHTATPATVQMKVHGRKRVSERGCLIWSITQLSRARLSLSFSFSASLSLSSERNVEKEKFVWKRMEGKNGSIPTPELEVWCGEWMRGNPTKFHSPLPPLNFNATDSCMVPHTSPLFLSLSLSFYLSLFLSLSLLDFVLWGNFDSRYKLAVRRKKDKKRSWQRERVIGERERERERVWEGEETFLQYFSLPLFPYPNNTGFRVRSGGRLTGHCPPFLFSLSLPLSPSLSLTHLSFCDQKLRE